MSRFFIISFLFLLFISTIQCQQMQWVLLSDGSDMEGPMARRDAAMGFDSTFLVIYGGRDQSGMPLQDSYGFNVLISRWERLDFPNPPSARYGMAATSSVGSGLYIFGGFGLQGTSQFNNPYLGYGASGLASYKQSPAVSESKQNQRPAGVMNKQNFYQSNPTGYSNYNDNDDRIDENFYPLPDAWFLNYATKSWQQIQQSQYARGLGSAAASPYTYGGAPRVIYSMGKSRDWMYSTVEATTQTIGFKQMGGAQSATIMYDLSSFSPAYPHARYSHSTTLLTDNHLLLYGGCLSGYGKGGPCPSKDTWLLHIDRGHWERLWECPPTKMGAAMVTLPSYSMCSMMRQGIIDPSQMMNMGNEQPVAVLWGGRERNPSSIVTYPSPNEEVAVFSLSQKEWFLKRAAPSMTGGSYPIQREGAAYVAGCLQGSPGMFIYGGRSVHDRRLLSDVWFLKASPQEALSTGNGRSCIYPYSFFHLHGMFQFFAYGVLFPIGYLVGRHYGHVSVGRPLHIFLQGLGVALAICGFSFGVHAVRAPSWLHFKHAHAIIGIITFILTMIQALGGLVGFFLTSRNKNKRERFDEGKTHKNVKKEKPSDASTWRFAHMSLGVLILALGFVNISLGVFLAVLPLPVWIIWFIYMGFLVLILVGMELAQVLSEKTKKSTSGTTSFIDKREDPRGKSQTSLVNGDDEHEKHSIQPKPRATNTYRPIVTPTTSFEPHIRENPAARRQGSTGFAGDDMAPLINHDRQTRPGDVTGAGRLPDYHRPNDREYPVPTRKRSGPAENAGIEYYTGYGPEPAQNSLSRPSVQQQNEHNLTRVRLQ